jgi:hypothetical protein
LRDIGRSLARDVGEDRERRGGRELPTSFREYPHAIEPLVPPPALIDPATEYVQARSETRSRVGHLLWVNLLSDRRGQGNPAQVKDGLYTRGPEPPAGGGQPFDTGDLVRRAVHVEHVVEAARHTRLLGDDADIISVRRAPGTGERPLEC